MKCSICGNPVENDRGWKGGHNAQPINDGRCCGSCNAMIVLPRRFHDAQGKNLLPQVLEQIAHDEGADITDGAKDSEK